MGVAACMKAARVMIRCDGGSIAEVGTGHVVRCLSLASGLVAQGVTDVSFVMRKTEWNQRVIKAGFQVEIIERDEQLVELVASRTADVVVLDDLGRCALQEGLLDRLKATGCIAISIDDPENAERADISVNPAFWGMRANYEGFEYSILASDVASDGAPGVPGWPERDLVFASFGGFDPGGAAQTFVDAWRNEPLDLPCVLALGGGQQLEQVPPGIEVVQDVDLTQILPRAALAVTNGGTTMLMAASMGAPVFSVAQYAHQDVNAARLEALGAARNFGMLDRVNFDEVLQSGKQLLLSRDRTMGHVGRQLMPGFGCRHLVQVVSVMARLDWDSDFFGHGIAHLFPRRLTSNILRYAEERCISSQIACLYFKCEAADRATQGLAEASGFKRVDDRLTYRMALDDCDDLLGTVIGGVREGVPADGTSLADIAGSAYESSRYFFDRRFPRERCQQFYRNWILKSLEGRFDDVVLVIEEAGQVVGYISCRVESRNHGRIGLVGVAFGARGKGLGTRLVDAARQWCLARNLASIEVVTQGRNTSAQRLYERTGFELTQTEVWYHRWFEHEDGESLS